MSDEFVSWREHDHTVATHKDVHTAEKEAVKDRIDALARTSGREDVMRAQLLSLLSLGLGVAAVVIAVTK